MSCMVMKEESLAALANAIESNLNGGYSLWGFEAPDSLYDALEDCRIRRWFSAKAIYDKMYAFNIKAYNSRYAEHEGAADDIPPEVDLSQYKIHQKPEYRNGNVIIRPWHYHLAKLLDFYIYQTNECATYKDPLWAAMLEFSNCLNRFIVRRNPEYDTCGWGQLPPQKEEIEYEG